MKKSICKLSESVAPCDTNAPVPIDLPNRFSQHPVCAHDWHRDGQTMTSVRWTCTKCHETRLNSLDI